MPRQKFPIAGIVLAAGRSVRFGALKQLHRIGGEPIVSRVVATALESRLDHVFLVLGHRAADIRRVVATLLRHPRLSVVVNEAYEGGMATSLQCGIAHARKRHPSAMILLGDMPRISSGIIDRLIDRFSHCGHEICVPVFNGERGHPVILGRPFHEAIFRITGDVGAKSIIEAHPEDVLEVQTDDTAVLWDIDTPE